MKPNLFQLVLIFGAAGVGVVAALAIGLPIPFLLGSLVGAASLSMTLATRTDQRLYYPQLLREVFVAVIGVMIGATFTPAVIDQVPSLTLTLGAMTLFVGLVQGVNYVIFRHIGKYDRATATFAAMPGGLIEAVSLGERAKADVETLTIQHFVRIVLVIVAVPLLFLAFTGESVGSAAGETLQTNVAKYSDWLLTVILALSGLFIGKRFHLPAAPLLGPLVITALLQATQVVDMQGPQLLLNVAQFVVGASLGAQFAKSRPRQLATSIGLGLLSVTVTLAIAALAALALMQVAPFSFQMLFISFSPGGITEMSLIALSLEVSPVLVSTHHLFRILLTVLATKFVASFKKMQQGDP